MIIQWIWGALTSFAGWLVGILPAPTLPTWLTSAPAAIQSFMSNLDGFGNWLPLQTIVDGLAFMIVVLGIGGLIKVIRIFASFLTAGGGSAA